MPRPREQGRTRRALSADSSSPSTPIPLSVLRQSFLQNSSADSSNLSSSESPSSTPPSSAEQLPPQETWPSTSENPARSVPTPPHLSQLSPTTEAHALAATSDPDVQPIPPGDHGSQATPTTQQEQDSDSTAVTQGSLWVRLGRWVSKRGWFQSTLGISSLIVSLVSLFVYGLRSYEMARWSERNDYLQMCAGLIQANVTGGPDCARVLREGPTLPPHSKRAMIYSPGVGAYELARRATTFVQRDPYVDWTVSPFSKYGFSGLGKWALVALSTLAVVGGLLALLRSRTPEETGYTSTAKSEGVRVTRYHPEGSEVVEPEGPIQIIKRHPPENQAPGEIRRRINRDRYHQEDDVPIDEGGLPWEPMLKNGSEDTLVAARTESNSRRVSIVTGPDEGLHDGLIELKPTENTKNTKNFLNPETGDSYHLSPWKSTHDDDEDKELLHNEKSKPEGTVKRAILGMGVGAAALANGKAIEDDIAESLQKKERIPQQTGDCLAGEVTNEKATGKPALARDTPI